MAEHRTKRAASFLNYAPISLAFGTSGLRGLVKNITDLEAYINVKATLRYLLSIGDIHADSTVVIAGDLRPSTDRIMRACAQAIVDSVCQVENAGKIPTPALVSHAISTRRAGELPRWPPTNPFQSCPILDSNPCQVAIRSTTRPRSLPFMLLKALQE